MSIKDNGHEEFVPEIVAFTCIYCGYMAADTAGALRLKYPSNVRLVRLPAPAKPMSATFWRPLRKGPMGSTLSPARWGTATTCMATSVLWHG